MQKANRLQGRWHNIVFLSIALLVVLADQLSKAWIRSSLALGETLFDTGLLRIVRIYNTGGAFGILPAQSLVLTVVAFVGIFAILFFGLYLCRRWPVTDNLLLKSAIGLVLGGAAGNLIDRLIIGHVTDFIDFRIWPAFNLADASITVGSLLVAYFILRVSLAEKH